MLRYLQSRVARSRTSPVAESDSYPPFVTSRGERIAIVDDEAMMATVTAELLDHMGYATIKYSSAEKFIKAFEADPDHVDLIVSDVVMPDMSGIQLVRALREDGHNVPIVLMTGFSVQKSLQSAAGAGRIAVIRKPFTSAHLAQSVRRMLASSR